MSADRNAAIGYARAIAGSQSPLGDRDRLAMPDEVLLFRTGTDRDKALLAFCLITLSPAIGADEKRSMVQVFTQAWRTHLTHADVADH